MSGGSYNYLCYHSDSLSEHRSDLESMAERIEGLAYAGQAAADTRRVLALLDEAQRLAGHLADVWRAVEWWDSGDYGEDQVVEEMAKYVPLGEQPAEDPTALERLTDGD